MEASIRVGVQPWLNEFLRCRGLDAPDGRALFAYKVTAAEFDALQHELAHAGILGLSTKTFSSAWLLFAAEWWRRTYVGGAWAWRPIFDAIATQFPGQIAAQEIVMAGRRYWKLQSEPPAGRRFIGEVAINGGIPLGLLKEAQGSLVRMLRSALRQGIDYSLSRAQIYVEIERQSQLLPQTFRQPLIYDLLTGLVESTQLLRAQYGLAGEDDPVAKLDRAAPAWKDSFPIGFDEASAGQLIKGLVREASQVVLREGRHPFHIVRRLRFTTEGQVTLDLAFEMPSEAKLENVASALQLESSSLPAAFQLLLRIDGRDYAAGDAIRRGERIRLQPRHPAFPPHAATAGVSLVVSRFGSDVLVSSLPGGDPLAPEEPWVFEDGDPVAAFVGAGHVRRNAPTALVLIATPGTVSSEAGPIDSIGDAGLHGMRLYRIQSGLSRANVGPEEFVLECGSRSSSEQGSFWHGARLGYPSVPSAVYTGMPCLFAETESGAYHAVPKHELVQLLPGGIRRSVSLAQFGFGPSTLVWEHAREIRNRTRAVLLPDSAEVRFTAGSKVGEGSIELVEWPCTAVSIDDPAISADICRNDANWRLDIRSRQEAPPLFVRVNVFWPSGNQMLMLPFPGEGALLVDGDNHPMPAGQSVTVDQLSGMRILFMSGQGARTWTIGLRLQGVAGASRPIRHEIRYRDIAEVRLFELQDLIERMLSCSPHLDARLVVDVESAGKAYVHLLVHRYAFKLNLDSASGRLNVGAADKPLGPSAVEGVKLLALPVQFPEQDPIELRKLLSEGVFTGDWQVSFESGGETTWLIYPDAVEGISCRAMAIPGPTPVGRASVADCPLRNALGIANRDERLASIATSLATLATEPGNPGWHVIEHLLDRLGHLPLSSLDLWCALATRPAAMVIALLHLEGFAEKYAARVSAELPFEWFLSAPQDWISAFGALKQFYAATGDERGFRMLQMDIDAKREQMLHLQPALKLILQLAYHQGFHQRENDVYLYMNPAIGGQIVESWLDQQLVDENCELQSLLRRAASDDSVRQSRWQMTLTSETSRYLQRDESTRIRERLKIPLDDYKIGTIVLPFAVALDVVQGRSSQWRDDPHTLFSLRQHREFDRLWFDSAYFAGLALAYREYKPG